MFKLIFRWNRRRIDFENYENIQRILMNTHLNDKIEYNCSYIVYKRHVRWRYDN